MAYLLGFQGMPWGLFSQVHNAHSDDRLSLIRFLREHESLPFVGKLVRAKSPDTIVVEVDGKYINFHLDGVTDEGLSEVAKNDAIAFLNGLTKVGYGDCEASYPAHVTLYYGVSIFQGHNNLSGNALIKNGSYICKGTAGLKKEDLTGGSNVINLNYLLIKKGLASSDDFVDPKWPADLTKYRGYSGVAKKAREKNLYIYGGKTDSLVEKIIGRKSL